MSWSVQASIYYGRNSLVPTWRGPNSVLFMLSCFLGEKSSIKPWRPWNLGERLGERIVRRDAVLSSKRVFVFYHAGFPKIFNVSPAVACCLSVGWLFTRLMRHMPCSRFPHSLLCFVIPVPRVLILWYKSQALNYASLSELRTCVKIEVAVLRTLQAPLSGTFLQTLPDLVTPLKGHSLSPRSCPPTRSAPSGYW